MSDEHPLYGKLRKGFKDVINEHCGENVANIPDFIIAEHLVSCFQTLNWTTEKRDKWYDVHLEPANKYFEDPPSEEKEESQ